MTKRTYSTDHITVFWDSSRCIHTGRCLRALPEVFDTARRPWVDIAAAEADDVAAAILKCPSGALRFERPDGAGEEASQPTTVVPIPHGPLAVRGDIEVRDATGELFDAGYRMTLCRCGHSKNQPFCDLSHQSAGFRDNPRVMPEHRERAESPADVTDASD